MKSLKCFWTKALVLVVAMFISSVANAAEEDFLLSVRNLRQTAPNQLEFDLYLLDTDPGQEFQLSHCQFGFLINANIMAGGELSVAIDNTGSGLLPTQWFVADPRVTFPLAGFPDNAMIMHAGNPIVMPGGGTIISTSGDGTLLTRFILRNSVDFAPGTVPDLAFIPTDVTGPRYPTRVGAFFNNVSTNLEVFTGVNAIVEGNPVLNPPLPVAYTVSGGGEYCEGGTGVEVRLSGSESDATYTLIRDGNDLTPEVSGTGSALSFGFQTIAGTYTVRGTNAGGSTAMNGDAVVVMRPRPAATISGSTAVCHNSTSPLITFTNPRGLPVIVIYNINGASESSIIIAASSSSTLSVPTSSVGTFTYNLVSVEYQTPPSCSSGISGSATVTVNPIPSVGNQTTSVNSGSAFTVTPTGVPAGTTYTWPVPVYTGGVTGGQAQSTGATSISGTLSIPSGTGTAVYTVTPRSGDCTGATFTVTVTVTSTCEPVSITSQPANASICGGGSASFSITATGTSPTYQWQYSADGSTWANVTNGTPAGASYSNATTTTLGVSGITAAGSYRYRCVATNCGSSTATSSSATLTVNAVPLQPVVTVTQPSCAVATGTISVTSPPSGAGMTYSIDGSNYSNTSGTFTGVAPGTYSVTARSSAGCTSPVRSVTINAQPPTPAVGNQTTSVNSGSTFTVTPTGVPAGTTYTWPVPVYTGGVTGGQAQSTGATSISGTLSIPSGTGTAVYTVTPRSGDCTGATFTVTVTVTSTCEPVTITSQPANASICGGGSASFSITATGTTPAYQWQYSADGSTWANVTNGTPAGASYSNATTTTLGVSGISAAGSYRYRCVATNCGSSTATSSSATLTVNAVPVQPVVTVTQPTCAVATGTIAVTSPPSGSGMTFSIDGNNYSNTSGTFTGVAPGTYSVTARSSAGCTSPVRSVTVNAQPPTPVVGNQATSVNSGSTFTVTPTGVPAGTTYTWPVPVYTGGVTGGQAQSTGVTSISGTLTIAGGSGTATYTVTPRSGDCVGTPFTVTVTVNSSCVPATITSQPSSVAVCSGDNASFSVTAQGTTPAYQWQYSADGSTWSNVTNGTPSGASYSNATTPTLGVSGTLTAGTYRYRCQVTNCGTITIQSAAATLTVNALPSQPTISPAGTVDICGGTSQTLTATSGETYLWSNGATTRSITVTTSGQYSVRVTNSLGCLSVPSVPTTVNINPLPATPTVTPSGSVSVCDGESITLTSSASSSYLWSNGATTRSIQVTTAGSYSVRVTDANGCQSLSSAATTVNVSPVPSPPTVGAITQPSCSVPTGSVVLSALPSGSWTIIRNPGEHPITGSGTTTTITGLPGGSYNFRVTSAEGCTSVNSVPVVINTPPAVPTAPVIGTVTQPTCTVATGSVGIRGLPSSGTWTLTRNPGNHNTTGSGANYTVSGLASGSYTFTVTNDAGCESPISAQAIIDPPPPVPAVPAHSVNCSLGAGNGVVTVTSPVGSGLEYRLNSGAWQTATTFNGVANGNYTITVRNAAGCTATGTQFAVNCGCVNPPTVTLSGSSGSTCGLTPVTVTGNTFAGSATSVTITRSGGGGTVTPASSSSSPFSFTYTPVAADAGRTVTITVTTNNPLGSPCAAATATYTLTVNALPAAPGVGARTHPTCTLPTGGVVLTGLPSSGDWTLTRTPGGVTTNGSGTSASVTGLLPGSYTFTVTNANGCTSAASAAVVINAQPETPTAPVTGVVTQPTCVLHTGSVAVSGLPATGRWTLTRLPGNVSISGSGASRTIANIPPGSYTFTVTNAAGCVSLPSDEFVVNPQPVTPLPPVIATRTHPTCDLATGSILLENLPESGEWTLYRYPGGTSSVGTGTSATISSLPPGTYNFAVRNSDGCTSLVSANAVINAQPPTPEPPRIGTITHPTFQVATGSVVLSGLPSSGTWILMRNPDGFTSQGTGTTRTVSGLEPGTYTFAVTNSFGCTSALTSDVVINARPGAPVLIINDPATICDNETTDLTADAVTAGSDANLTFTYWNNLEATDEYLTPESATPGTYYIRGTSTAGYYSTGAVVVTADRMPVSYAGPDQVLDYRFSTTMSADLPEIGTGIWALVSGYGQLNLTTDPDSEVTGLRPGENIFSWTVTNGVCEPAVDEVIIRVNDLTIPTLITPNNDGRNDFFVLRGLETLGRTGLTIFDRRGLMVYENHDYDNDWDGRDYNSNELPDDTYFYVIRSENGVSRSGYIVIRR